MWCRPSLLSCPHSAHCWSWLQLSPIHYSHRHLSWHEMKGSPWPMKVRAITFWMAWIHGALLLAQHLERYWERFLASQYILLFSNILKILSKENLNSNISPPNTIVIKQPWWSFWLICFDLMLSCGMNLRMGYTCQKSSNPGVPCQAFSATVLPPLKLGVAFSPGFKGQAGCGHCDLCFPIPQFCQHFQIWPFPGLPPRLSCLTELVSDRSS